MQREIEILSPVGNKKSFVAAINAGADAVYMGINKYNARAMTENFSVEEYCKAIYEAHKRDVKVYLTLNTLMKNDEIKDALSLLAEVYSYGLDAVIVQDLGLALKIHELFPNLPIHASTQMSVYSKEQVKFLKSIGFSRVVLARELSVLEIKEICDSTDIELEVFVHGALCVGLSGQCNMSRLIGPRSANRGSCAQPCRMKYSLYKVGEAKSILSNKYILSKKDIWGIDKVQDLVNAGVKSLKIEGRNKFPEYVAITTKLYKKSLTNVISEDEKKQLFQIFNRSGKSTGYLDGVGFRTSISQDTPKNTGVFLGKVMQVKNSFVKIKLEDKINLHDGIEIYSDEVVSTIVTCIKDDRQNVINNEMDKGSFVWIGDINSKCKIGDKIYKTSDSKLNESLNKEYVQKLTKRVGYSLDITICEGRQVTAIVLGKNVNVKYTSKVMAEKSLTKAITKQDIMDSFNKTQDTSVYFENVSINLDDNVYLSKASINEIRRDIVKEIESSYSINLDVSKQLEKIEKLNLCGEKMNKFKKQDSLFVYSYNPNMDYFDEYKKRYGKNLTRLVITANDYVYYEQDIFKKYSNIDLFFLIPNVTFKNLTTYIMNNIERLVKEGLKGILVGSLQYMDILSKLKENYNILLIADYSLNITNSLTINYLKKFGFDVCTLSFELDEQEIRQILPQAELELVENLACAMTTRYCLLGSFVGNKNTAFDVCSRPCISGKYYIQDTYVKQYYVVCDNIDCVMRLIRNKNRYAEDIEQNTNIRHVWL